MNNCYPVFLGEQTVGKVHISKKGLYYFLECTCNLATGGKFRLFAAHEQGTIPLGILVPDGRDFVLQMHLPSGRLKTENIRFYLSDRAEKSRVRSILRAEDTFPYLSKLETARISILPEGIYIFFPDEH